MKSLFRLTLIGLSFFSALAGEGQDWNLTNSFDDPTTTTQFAETGASAAVDGDFAVIGSPANNGNLGTAYVYEKQSGNWLHVATLNPGSLLTEIEDFGRAVDIEGETIVVGAPVNSNFNDGAVYIFEKPVSGWSGTLTETIRFDSPTPLTNGLFGQSLDLNGDELLVGAPFENSNLGRAHLFTKNAAASWTTATHSATFDHAVASNDDLGIAVGLTDDIAVLGAPGSGANAGNVFIYEKGASWSSKSTADAVLRKSNRSATENYGSSLTAEGDRIVVGMRSSSNNSVFVYDKPVSGWSAEYVANGTLEETYSIGSEDTGFGASLGLDGDLLLVGHPLKTNGTFSNNGIVYTYRLGASSAVQGTTISSVNEGTNVRFGSAVGLSSGELVIGAAYENTSGRVYLFYGEYITNLNESLCFGETFDFDGQTLSTSGVYNKSYTTTGNLDSLVTVNLTVNPQLNFAFNFDPILCNGETGGITFDSPTGGDGGPYEYSVDGVDFQVSPTFTGVRSGALTLVLRDGNGCTRSEGTFLQEPAELVIASTSIVHPGCPSSNDGSVDLQVTGGSNAYSYSLDGTNYTYTGAGINKTITIGGLVAGSYTVHVMDDNNCEKTSSVTLTEPPAIAIVANISGPYCNGESNGLIGNIRVNGGNGGPYTYSLDGTNFQTTNSFTGLSAGNYSVYVQDNSGCVGFRNYTMIEPGEISVSTTVTNSSSCSSPDGVISLAVTGGNGSYSYAIDGSPTNNPIIGLDAGTYSIEVTDPNGCSTTISESVTGPSGLGVAANFTDVTCFGAMDGTISAVGFSGVQPYEYSFDGGVTFSTTQSIAGLGPGQQDVVVRDANGCTAQTFVTLFEPTQLIASRVITNISCPGEVSGSILVEATGGTPIYFASLDGVNYESFSAGSTYTFESLAAGSYSVFVKDVNDCEETLSVTLSEPTAFTASTSVVGATCMGSEDGSITITASGGTGNLTYSLNGSTGQSSNQFSNLDPGTYQVTITDENDCSHVIDDVIVGSDVNIVISATVIDLVCNGENDGSISLAASGGATPYEYSLDGVDYQSSSDFENLSAGAYNVFVMDANGCFGEVSVAISEPTLVEVSVSQTHRDFTLTASGGISPYEYSLDGANYQSSSSFTGLGSGVYTFTVRDANDCTVESEEFTVVILDATDPTVSIYPNPAQSEVRIKGLDFDQVVIYDLSGTQMMSSWNEKIDVSSLNPGMYLISVQDRAGNVIAKRKILKH